jgi:hypothetical protein
LCQSIVDNYKYAAFSGSYLRRKSRKYYGFSTQCLTTINAQPAFAAADVAGIKDTTLLDKFTSMIPFELTEIAVAMHPRMTKRMNLRNTHVPWTITITAAQSATGTGPMFRPRQEFRMLFGLTRGKPVHRLLRHLRPEALAFKK